MSEEPTVPQSAEPMLVAAFVADVPVPTRALYSFFGSRTTFHEWERAGLQVKRVPGLGKTVIPSHFTQFLLVLRGDAQVTTLPKACHKAVERYLKDKAK